MVKPIEKAIADFDVLLLELPNPPENSAEWFKVRALVAGRSMLKAMEKKGIDERPAAAEAYYRGCRKRFAMFETVEEGQL